MKKWKRILTGLISLSAISSIVPIIVYSGFQINQKEHKNFDLGLPVNPIVSLNYIKYEEAVEAASPLVEGLAKGGPIDNSSIKNYLDLDILLISGKNSFTFPLDKYRLQTGTLRRSKNVISSINSGIRMLSKWNDKYTFNINGKSKWSNGELLKSSDFIDSLIAVLDLNSGSQRIKKVLDLGIKGTREFVDAQNDYARVFGVTYKNPFGYIYQKLPKNASQKIKNIWTYWKQDLKKGFPLQNSNHPKANREKYYVDKIKKTARRIGIYGDKYSSHPHPKGEILGWDKSNIEHANYKIKFKNDYIQPFKLDIRSEFKMTIYDFIVVKLLNNSRELIPINKNFIEKNGGIEEFGKSKSHFLTQGPFKIHDSTFGINGNMILKKNNNYWAANEIIPNTIKLFFQTDPITLGLLFEDNYISYAKIDSIFTKKFFSNPKTRNLIVKNWGYGMTGLIFNLDKEKNKNKHLMDPNFRKALLLAINRKEIIKISGFDFTFPSYSIIEPTTPLKLYIAKGHGVQAGNTLFDEKIYYSEEYAAPIISTSSIKSIGLSGQLFSNPDQTDHLQNIKLSQKIMNKYFKDNNIQDTIKIKFLNDSSPFMQNMGNYLKSQFKEIFGNKIKIETKALPQSLYSMYTKSGDFEMTWKNLDYVTVKSFFTPDGIKKENMKKTGFISNPVGSWTISNAFKHYQQKGIENKTRQRLRISSKIWNKIKNLVTYPKLPKMTKNEIDSLLKKRIISFFNISKISIEELPDSLKNNPDWNSIDPNFDTNREMMEIIIAANKIIMDQSPVIPLFRADVTVTIDQLPSVSWKLAQTGYGYLYDLIRKPKHNLPGLEIKNT